MATQAITFDAPLQQATTVNVPAGVTFDTPISSATTVDLSQQQPSPSQQQTAPNVLSTPNASAQAASTQNLPQFTIQAAPEPTGMAGRVERWADNVAHDLKFGTDLTGVGSVLKAMGAHGVYNGNSEAVGDFMASLPLGLAKALKGAAELPQAGKRWQGAKDVAGGALQAGTIPSAFVAPEGAEALSTGIDRAGDAVASGARAASDAVKRPFDLGAIQNALQNASDAIQQGLASDTQNIQDAFHGSIRQLFDDVAKEAGVQPMPAESLHDVAANTAQALKAKASGLYKQIDQALGGTRFQTFDEQLSNVRRALRNSAGIDPDADGRLIERINDLEDAKAKAWEQAKAAGVDQKVGDTASSLWRQASALEDLSKHIQASTTGLRANLAQSVNAAQETLSPAKLATRANRMYNAGRLQQAIGERADDLLRSVETTRKSLQDVAERAAQQVEAAKATASQREDAARRNISAAKTAAGATLGGGVGYEALKHLLGW